MTSIAKFQKLSPSSGNYYRRSIPCSTRNFSNDAKLAPSTASKGYSPSKLIGETFTEQFKQTHISTSPFQKLLLTVGSGLMALSNPLRGDMVAIAGEVTGRAALEKLHQSMKEDPIGREILDKKPLISSQTLSLSYLRSLPENTFGRSYINWMDNLNLSVDSRAYVRFVDDPELAYVMTRYRQVHDFWHVMSGLEISVMAELAVKMLEFQVTGLPMNILSALAGPVQLSFSELDQLQREYYPWAVRCGQNCKPLMNVYYEKHFEEDLSTFRKSLNFEPFSTFRVITTEVAK